jgi:hypothetical protein
MEIEKLSVIRGQLSAAIARCVLTVVRGQLFKAIYSSSCGGHKQRTTDHGQLSIDKEQLTILPLC